ncbi:MAG: methyltransferase domain-containing protein [Proteobacteria bacterium]|nr:methyltransferase domain-containing protein [Pseudomonadota bacterium]
MEQHHREFAGSIPENYERYFVPLIFADYASLLAEALQAPEGSDVLETACGTGIVTRNIADKLGPKSRLIATDLNEPMIVEAQKAMGAASNVAFRQADATVLPFESGSFDAVVCQFGVMFFPDRMRGYREAARVLTPGGRYLFNVWDSLDNNLFAKTIHDAVGRLYPDDPPKFLELPYGYCDLRLIVKELQEAGFSKVDVYWEGEDEDGEGNGEWETVQTAECDPSWIAYLIAEK